MNMAPDPLRIQRIKSNIPAPWIPFVCRPPWTVQAASEGRAKYLPGDWEGCETGQAQPADLLSAPDTSGNSVVVYIPLRAGRG